MTMQELLKQYRDQYNELVQQKEKIETVMNQVELFMADIERALQDKKPRGRKKKNPTTVKDLLKEQKENESEENSIFSLTKRGRKPKTIDQAMRDAAISVPSEGKTVDQAMRESIKNMHEDREDGLGPTNPGKKE